MSLYKRNKTWHADFSVDGKRFRVSLETTDWREAQAKERELIADAKLGKISPTKLPIARSTFREAAEEFLQDRLPRLAPLSVRTERERAKVISLKLGDMQVSRITADTILAYIRERKASGISNATVNRELDIFRGVLKKAKRWHLFADEIRPLPIRQSIGRALTHEERVRLLNVAVSRPEWQNAAWATTLALNSTMRGCEIRQLRWRDVDLIERTLTIRKSKTEAGERVLPLNADAWSAVLALYQRAKVSSDVRPEHYVFPACEASHVDPRRPMAGWRTAWRSLTRAIECPACGKLQNPSDSCSNEGCNSTLKGLTSPLSGLRFHDLRHHAITELAESQASDSTIMAIAGHVSPKMLQHYSHVRIQAKRQALDALSARWAVKRNSGGNTPGYVTNNVTKMRRTEGKPAQVSENMVELVGIEPTTSSLRTMRSPS